MLIYNVIANAMKVLTELRSAWITTADKYGVRRLHKKKSKSQVTNVTRVKDI
jgi:hypothetical protein